MSKKDTFSISELREAINDPVINEFLKLGSTNKWTDDDLDQVWVFGLTLAGKEIDELRGIDIKVLRLTVRLLFAGIELSGFKITKG